MDPVHLLLIFAAFTAILSSGTVLLLCHTLKKNNEHVRSMLNQLASWKNAGITTPSRAERQVQESEAGVPTAPLSRLRSTQLDTEETQAVVDPAADGTLAYIHPKSTTINRPVVVRNEPGKPSVEARPPIYIDSPANDAAFTGMAVAIGFTEPDEGLSQSIGELVRKVTKDGGLAFVLGSDEFILTYASGDRKARRDLDELAEDLWKLQFQSSATSPALLAWGVAEASGEPLPAAMESAFERMREVRRIRKRGAGQSGPRTPAVYTSLLGRLLALRNSGKVRSNYHPEITVLVDTDLPDEGA